MNVREASMIVRRALPKGKIHRRVEFGNFYLFMIFMDDENEGSMDAIYSVDKETGEFKDFPYMDDDIFEEVIQLFADASNAQQDII